MNDIPDLKITGRVQTLSLKPGDVIMLRVDHRMSESNRRTVVQHLERTFPGRKFIVTEPGFDLSIVRSEVEKIRRIKNEMDSGMDHDPQAALTNLHLWMRALVDALLPDDGAVESK